MSQERLTAKLTSRGHGGRFSSDNRYEATFTEEPTDEDVRDAQNSLGYNTAGYGGPYNIRRTHILADTSGAEYWKVTWISMATCD
jgi:hypothetical protein